MGTSEAQALLGRMWADIQRASQQRELEAIRATPDKHRLTRLMDGGRNTGYVYWPAGQRMIGKTKKEKESFCVAKHKNATGVFLVWRQVNRFKKKRGTWHWYEAQRFDFQWAPTKKEAREIASKKAERRKLNIAHEAAAKLPHAPPEAYAMLSAAIGA